MQISSEQYKALRIECTKGQSHQLKIFNTYCKKIDNQNILDFTKLLVNVTVANLQTQQEVFSMLPSIDLTPENSKFVFMIVNNTLEIKHSQQYPLRPTKPIRQLDLAKPQNNHPAPPINPLRSRRSIRVVLLHFFQTAPRPPSFPNHLPQS